MPSATGSDYKRLGVPFHPKEFITHIGQRRGGFGALDDSFPLMAAVASGRPERGKIVIALLKAGADINQTTSLGKTVLHQLSQPYEGFISKDFSLNDANETLNDTLKLLLTLIDHGADVNICDNHGKSPLHYAAQNGTKFIAKILLQKGADVYLNDKVGLNALDHAAMANIPLTLALVENYNFPVHQVIRAYECVASHSRSPFEILQKATLLREEHGIRKSALAPLECYGFKKEWETSEELERFRNDEVQLTLSCILARERITKETRLYIPPETRNVCK